MLNPAGDAQHAGRTIEGNFERGTTQLFVEELKRVIESRHSNIRVIITRIPGETLQPLQNASFANRLGADLYFSIHFYQKEGRQQLYLYRFCQNPVTDGWQLSDTTLSFVPFNKAHIANLSLTKNMASKIISFFEKTHTPFSFYGPLAIPFAPLIGIKAPALAFEMSLAHNNDWNYYIAPLADCIGVALEVLKKGDSNND